jgi:hypothetical protein
LIIQEDKPLNANQAGPQGSHARPAYAGPAGHERG